MMKKKYYFMHCIEDETLGVGYAEEGYDFDYLKEGQYYEHWMPITFILKNGSCADYQTNDLSWPLCSERLKNIIEQYKSPRDIIQWLQANVVCSKTEQKVYFILHLPEGFNVLNEKKTVFSGDFPVKPYLNLKAIGEHHVFRYRGSLFRPIVSAEIRDAIIAAGCTGQDFYEARVI
jgi:hypothetical protein